MHIAYTVVRNSRMRECSAPDVAHSILEIVRKYRKRSSMIF